jgi:hypothetical protein
MLSRIAQKQLPFMVNTAARSFRAAAVANKKPSIGDAVTILQSKVSGISQVVSIDFHIYLGVFVASDILLTHLNIE